MIKLYKRWRYNKKKEKFFKELFELFDHFDLGNIGSCLFIDRYFYILKSNYTLFLFEKFPNSPRMIWSVKTDKYEECGLKWHPSFTLLLHKDYINKSYQEIALVRMNLINEFFNKDNLWEIYK